MTQYLLSVMDLRTYFSTPDGLVKAVDGVGFSLEKGKTLCLLGESGSGKSVTAMSLIGLVDSVPGIVGGEIVFDGTNLLEGLSRICSIRENNGRLVIRKNTAAWRKMQRRNLAGIRGKRIALIFQDPVSSLDPLYTVGTHLAESIRLRQPGLSNDVLRTRAIDWLGRVKIAAPHEVIDAYPFQLSGGMAQRVMIAVSLAGAPDLLIADEPTTALDATIQLDILRLLKSLQRELGLSILFITHDIGIGAHFADNIAVMYRGKIVQSCSREEIFLDVEGRHPYTAKLMDAARISY